MSLRISQNITAMNAHRWMNTADSSMSKSIERLSSGYRINSAADDAAGLVISEGLRTQVSGLTVAQQNTQDGINMIKTSEAALNEVETQLRNMRDLTLHAANNANNSGSLAADSAQMSQASDAIDRISTQTEFAGVKLLDATSNIGTGTFFQIGANAGQQASFDLMSTSVTYDGVTVTGDMSASGLGIDTLAASVLSGTSAGDFDAIVNSIDTALKQVNGLRVNLGAFQKNNLESNLNSISVASENLSASESAIRDTDMAAEMTNFTKNQILVQSASAMLTQANQSSQNILQMLR
ncbi:MAG TPA: flagellin [Armatimonadota bacterium]|nr:flagellin [Armatimonadota bacterium]